MTQPRHRLVCLDQTHFYHCISRCVRRAYLCGRDRFSGKDFSHRRRWIENQILRLAEIFSIEVLSYAVMSNHYHVVLRIDSKSAAEWSSLEVERRWSRLYRLPAAYVLAKQRSEIPANQDFANTCVETWRARLTELGWFMRAINEPLARIANKEDECTGRFWEGRFRSQALLDEAAVLRCMAYVDLNPVRAGICRSPALSRFTSIRARLGGRGQVLARFSDDHRSGSAPTSYRSYLQLINWTSDALQTPAQTARVKDLSSIFQALEMPPDRWLEEISQKKPFRKLAMGSLARIRQYRDYLDRQFVMASQTA